MVDSEQILPFCTNTLQLVQETLKILFVMTAGLSLAFFWKKSIVEKWWTLIQILRLWRRQESHGASSGEYGGFEICVSCLSVTQVYCDMTLNAGVMCLGYEGPQDNGYSIQIYILEAVMVWLLWYMVPYTSVNVLQPK